MQMYLNYLKKHSITEKYWNLNILIENIKYRIELIKYQSILLEDLIITY